MTQKKIKIHLSNIPFFHHSLLHFIPSFQHSFLPSFPFVLHPTFPTFLSSIIPFCTSFRFNSNIPVLLLQIQNLFNIFFSSKKHKFIIFINNCACCWNSINPLMKFSFRCFFIFNFVLSFNSN